MKVCKYYVSVFLILALCFAVSAEGIAFATENVAFQNLVSKSSNSLEYDQSTDSFSTGTSVAKQKKMTDILKNQKLQSVGLDATLLLLVAATSDPIVVQDPYKGTTYGTHAFWEEQVKNHTHLTSIPSDRTLTTGIYYINQNFTFSGDATNINGLTIQGNVTLRFENGATLSATGYDGVSYSEDNENYGERTGSTGGGAGIYLGSGSTLTVEGAGSIYAKGGQGSEAKKPLIGHFWRMPKNIMGGIDKSDIDEDAMGGYGGAGGGGGGGAGAGIGTSGSNGSDGGDRTAYCTWKTAGYTAKNRHHWSCQGFNGNNGSNSVASNNAGKLVQKGNVVVKAVSGDSPQISSRDGANAGGVCYNKSKIPELYKDSEYTNSGSQNNTNQNADHYVWDGGGGGAGGSGGAGAAIGSGGTGGAGGGSGSSGGKVWTESDNFGNSYLYYMASGGGGGAGRFGGKGGMESQFSNYPQTTGDGIYAIDARGKTGGSSSSTSAGSGGKVSSSVNGGDGGAGGSSTTSGTASSTSSFTVKPSLSSSADSKTYKVDGNETGTFLYYPIEECKVELRDSDSATLRKVEYTDNGVTKVQTAYKCTGKAVQPQVFITHVPTGTVVPSYAYIVEYENNIDPGTATLSLKPSNSSKGSSIAGRLEAKFDIRRDAEDFEFVHTNYLTTTLPALTTSTEENPAYKYTGSEVVPTYALRHKINTNYTVPTTLLNVAYSRTTFNNVNVGNLSASDFFKITDDELWFKDGISKQYLTKFSIVTTATINTTGWTSSNENVYDDLIKGSAYSKTLKYETINEAPYDDISWRVISGSLPPGLSIDAATGEISGVPTTSNSTVVEISATTLAGNSATKTLRWRKADITGVVKTADEIPCDEVSVVVSDPKNGEILKQTTTNNDGKYQVSDIPDRPRTVKVSFSTDYDSSGRPQRIIESDKEQTVNLDSDGQEECNATVQKATKVLFTIKGHGIFANNKTIFYSYGYSGDDLKVPIPYQIDKGWSVKRWVDAENNEPMTVYPTNDQEFWAVMEEGKYTLHYNAQGGTKKDGSTYSDWTGVFYGGISDDSTECILPYQNPVKKGYKFEKWHVEGNESKELNSTTRYGDLVYDDDSITEATVIAKWKLRDDIKITLDANGTKTSLATISGATKQTFTNKTTQEVIDYETPIRAGYTFKGWSLKKTSSEAVGEYVPEMTLVVPSLDENETELTYYAIWSANDISVEFNTTGGTSTSDELEFNKKPGETYSVPESPTRMGYKFTGWFSSPNKSSEKYKATNLGVAPNEDVAYYAQWEALETKVTLISNEATPAKQEKIGKYGEYLEYVIPEKGGYTFVGWKLEGADDATAEYFVQHSESDKTYVAVFVKGAIRVVFDPNGGSFSDESETGIRRGVEGDIFTPPSKPVRTGYNFLGWNLNLDGTQPAPSDNKIPSKSATYYACWGRKTNIQVTLNAENAVTFATQVKKGTFEETVDYDIPTRIGYAFAGWKLKGAADSTAIVSLKYPAEDTTYEAVWEKGVAFVIFNTEGGTFSDDDENGVRVGKTGDSYTAPKDPHKDGYEFKGWFTPLGDQGIQITDFVFSNNETDMLYAKWEAKDITVILDAGEGASPERQEIVGNVGQSVTGWTKPSRIGYVFKGWKVTQSDASATFAPKFPTEDVTYTALWSKADIVVTMVANGGAFPNGDVSIEYYGSTGESYAYELQTPTRVGYEFNGWWTLPVGGEKVDESLGLGTFPTKSKTIYAQWNPKLITVTLKADLATPAQQIKMGEYGAQIYDYDTPILAGYTFVGWKLQGTDDVTAKMIVSYPEEDSTFEAVWETEVNVVFFNPYGGSFTTSGEDGFRKGTSGSSYKVPENPVRDGSRFAGWYDAPTGGNKMSFDSTPTFSSSFANVVYYAHWVTTKSTVVLMQNDGTNKVYEEWTDYCGQAVPYSAPTLEGYSFKGWSDDKDAETGTFALTYPESTVQNNKKVYYAIWSSEENTVIFNAQGGTWATSENGIRSGKTGDSFTSPSDPILDGYEFEGWYDKASGGSKFSISVIPGKQTELYAHWKIQEYETTLNANGGTISGESFKTFTGVFDTNIDYEIPIKLGYTFVGWSSSQSGGDNLGKSIKIASKNETYYAVWEAMSVKFIFEANGGTIFDGDSATQKTTKTINGKAGNTITFSEPAATREGYSFDGWYDKPEGGSKITIPSSFPMNDSKVYAHWKGSTIKLYLDLNGGNIEGQTSKVSLQGLLGDEVTYTSPTKTGYVFKGFKFSQDAADSTAKVNFTYPATTEVTYYAVWADAENVTVSFNTMGGQYSGVSPTTTFTGKAGTKFTSPKEPTKTGYVFAGWAKDPNAEAIDFGSSTSVTYPNGSTIYYAIWQKKDSNVILNANGGIFSDAKTTKTCSGKSGDIIDYEIPTRTNFAFAGWETSDHVIVYNITLSDENKGKEYKAIWTESIASVVFVLTGVEVYDATEYISTVSDGKFNVPTSTPTRAAYKFDGWYDGPGDNAKKLNVSAGTSVTITSDTSSVYYSHWTIIKTNLILNENYSGAKLTTYSGIEGDVVSCITPTRAGYTFEGWSTNRNAQFGDLELFYPEASLDDSSITYYATWSKQKHHVYFQTEGGIINVEPGTEKNNVTQFYGNAGDEVSIPSDPERGDYEFKGWYTEKDGNGQKLTSTPTIPLDKDAYYYAYWVKIKGSVTFKANGGSFTSSTSRNISLTESGDSLTTKIYSVNYGDKVAYDVPDRDGYGFVGWQKDEATKEDYEIIYDLMMDEDVDGSTYSARWSANVSTVAFVATQADNSSESNVVRQGKFGSFFEVPTDPIKAGYTFEGWYTNPVAGKRLDKMPGDTMKFDVSNPAVYYAHFTSNSITVTLKSNGGNFTNGITSTGRQMSSNINLDASPTSIEVKGKTDEAVNYVAPVKAGYTFLGWNDSGDANDINNPPTVTLTYPANDSVYVACWEADVADITFMAPGGYIINDGVSSDTSSKTYSGRTGDNVQFSNVTATKTGYKFEGWNVLPTYNSITNLEKKFEPGSKYYFAKFKATNIELKLEANGGSFITSRMSYISGSYDQECVFDLPTRKGFTLAGWATRADAMIEDAQYDLIFGHDIAVDGATLYAIWIPGSITVEYDAQGGTFEGGEEKMLVSGKAEKTYQIPDNPTRTGYEFKGWWTLPNGKGEDVSTLDVYPTEASCIYYASWERKSYNLTLDANGGKFNDNTTLKRLSGLYGNDAEYTIPTKSGYIFSGWNDIGIGDSGDFRPKFNESNNGKTLKALWKTADASVVFLAVGADIKDTTIQYVGSIEDEFKVPYDPIKTGSKFVGWYDATKGGNRLNLDAREKFTLTESTPRAYYARFEEKVTRLNLHANNGTDDVEEASGVEGTTVFYDAPQKAGYNFKGWSASSNTDNAEFGLYPTYPSANEDGETIDWYAIWEKRNVCLTFDAQGGAYSDNTQALLVKTRTDDFYELPETPVKLGYTFQGWFMKRNGKGEMLLNKPIGPSYSKTYYAYWTADNINVTFDANGGYFVNSSYLSTGLSTGGRISRNGIYKQALSYDVPQRDGYTFKGWNETGDLNDEVMMSLTFPSTSKIYKAVWEPKNIRITYVADGSEINGVSSNFIVSYVGRTDETINFSVPYAQKEGYSFIGWTTYAGSNNVAENPRTYPTQDATYYAILRNQQVTVNLNANGGSFDGSELKSFTDQYGFVVSYDTPTWDGHFFKGWGPTQSTDDSNISLTLTYGKEGVANGSTFYAQWGELTHLSLENQSIKNEIDDAMLKVAKYQDDISKLQNEKQSLIDAINNSLGGLFFGTIPGWAILGFLLFLILAIICGCIAYSNRRKYKQKEDEINKFKEKAKV